MIPSQVKLVFVLTVLIVSNHLVSSVNVSPRANSNDLVTRLLHTSFPIHYDLSLTIDVDGGVFNGTVVINLNVTQPTNTILLNLKAGTELSSYNLERTSDSSAVPYASVDVNNDQEYLQFSYGADLIVGNYDLTLFFFGDIRDDLQGLYFSSYWTSGVKKTVALTTFAPNHARKVFPCYDEPSFKAIFTVHIKHAAKYFALSNMPVSNINTADPNWPTTSFQPSVTMSTYLLAFTVTDFVQNFNATENVSVYAQPDKFHLTDYALNFGIEARRNIENYVQRSYQLPKMDLVAFDDFMFNAMENWGLITFRWGALLYNTVTMNDIQVKQDLSETITHEIIHMWFGNEVTCNWFSEVWLNEGVTTFLTHMLTDGHVPEWGLRDQFVLRPTQFAMYRDALPTARAMTRDVVTFGDLDSVYGYESYDKAAAVIRMMLHVMLNDVFKAGLRLYVNRRSFQTATPDDLYAAFQTEFDLNPPSYTLDYSISDIFKSWANTPGFPVLTAQRNYDNSSLTVSQERFVVALDGLNGNPSGYFIPINYVVSTQPSTNLSIDNLRPTHWLTTSSNNFQIEAMPSEWIILNREVTGYYRVNYDARNWNMISHSMQNDHLNIHARNRAQLIDDALNLAKYGHLSYEIALEVTRYLTEERHYVPLKAAFNNFQPLEISLRNTSASLHEYVFERLSVLFDDLGMGDLPGDNHLRKLLRYDVSQFACRFGHVGCIDTAYMSLQHNLHGSIAPDFQPAVFCGAVQHSTGGDLAFQSLLTRLHILTATEGDRAVNSREISTIISAFGCLKTQALQESALDIVLSGRDQFERSYRSAIFVAVAGGTYDGLMRSLHLLLLNYRALETELESLVNVFGVFGTHIHTGELQTMFLLLETYVSSGNDANIAAFNQAKSDIEWNRQWMVRNVDVIDKWLTGGVTILRGVPLLIIGLTMFLYRFA